MGRAIRTTHHGGATLADCHPGGARTGVFSAVYHARQFSRQFAGVQRSAVSDYRRHCCVMAARHSIVDFRRGRFYRHVRRGGTRWLGAAIVHSRSARAGIEKLQRVDPFCVSRPVMLMYDPAEKSVTRAMSFAPSGFKVEGPKAWNV